MAALTIKASKARVTPLLADDVTVTEGETLAVSNARLAGVGHLATAYLFVYALGGHAACAAAVRLHFQGSPDGEHWFDLQDPASVTLDGTTPVQRAFPLDLRGLPYLRLARIVSEESESGHTAIVNAWLCATLGGLR